MQPSHHRSHHREDGGYRNPWNVEPTRGSASVLKWVAQRFVRRVTGRLPREPDPASFRRASPTVRLPRAADPDFLATWVGHSTFLIQLGGVNILTDPMWGARASPVRFAGPRRWQAPGLPLEALPPIDVVLQSHNHYDHLDRGTVRWLAAAHPSAQWCAPLGVGSLLRRFGVRRTTELDWWETTSVAGLRIACTPACHFSARGLHDRNATLWCGWTARSQAGAVFFAGDTGVHPEFAAIGERFGAFDLALLPVGAYEPRWFMKPVHMAPEEAVDAYDGLRAAHPAHRMIMAGMHWGTFKLTDESMDEPPARTSREWARRGHAPDDLWIPAHGETRRIERAERR
jgi:N-acyl-phosphatidylethanolamine-hydrolysing phospholipase D